MFCWDIVIGFSREKNCSFAFLDLFIMVWQFIKRHRRKLFIISLLTGGKFSSLMNAIRAVACGILKHDGAV
jgi:hypothetical protein